jgi:hypothetical protein
MTDCNVLQQQWSAQPLVALPAVQPLLLQVRKRCAQSTLHTSQAVHAAVFNFQCNSCTQRSRDICLCEVDLCVNSTIAGNLERKNAAVESVSTFAISLPWSTWWIDLSGPGTDLYMCATVYSYGSSSIRRCVTIADSSSTLSHPCAGSSGAECEVMHEQRSVAGMDDMCMLCIA